MKVFASALALFPAVVSGNFLRAAPSAHDVFNSTTIDDRELQGGFCRPETNDDTWTGPQFGCGGDLFSPREEVPFTPTIQCALKGKAGCCNTRENRNLCLVACELQANGRKGCCAYNAPRAADPTSSSGTELNGPTGCTFAPAGEVVPSSGGGTWGYNVAPVCSRETTDPNWSGPPSSCGIRIIRENQEGSVFSGAIQIGTGGEEVPFTPTDDCIINGENACCDTQENRERCRVACQAHANGQAGCCQYDAPGVVDSGTGGPGCSFFPDADVFDLSSFSFLPAFSSSASNWAIQA